MSNAAAIGLVLSATAAIAGEQGRLPGGVTPTHYRLHVTPNAVDLTFAGQEHVDIIVSQPTATITLNAADLTITHVKLDGVDAKSITLDEAAQTATFAFAETIAKGKHEIAISYTGKIYQSAAGLFAIDYPTKTGSERMLLTQFEATDARRFAPMWDEPGIKATFALSVDAPKGQTAFSNMPAASIVTHKDGSTTTTFEMTPKMSTYLLFFGVGQIERHTTRVGKTEIGVITRPGAGHQADYALASAARILKYYNKYFGTPYPLPKLDMIAAPGSSQFFGAMENWGAILYFERAILIDAKITSESDKQDVFNTVAHEMAHQWFGDLVTMQWWDDIWLNEGFASWMANKVSNDLNPEWQVEAQSVAGGRQRAFDLDARSSTHPIIRQIHTVDQIASAFDTITYEKGEAVIRMIEGAATPNKFRDGIRAYMAKHQYGNTVTDQLWDALEQSSGHPIKSIAQGFTLQGGVPLIKVSASQSSGGIQQFHLSQSRFGLDEASKAPLIWQVMIELEGAQLVPVQAAEVSATLIVSGSNPPTVSLYRRGDIIVDPMQKGYFRTLYDAASKAAIAQRFDTLPLIAQLGLIGDARALVDSGDQPADRYLALVSAIPCGAEPLLWKMVTGQLAGYDNIFDGAPMRAAYRAKALKLLRPQWARLGLHPASRERSADALLREELISTIARLGDAQAIEEIRTAMRQGFANPASLPGVIRRPVLTSYAYSIDSAGWNDLRHRSENEKDPMLKQDYYNALGGAHDLVIAQKALELSLSDDVPVPLRPLLIRAVSRNHPSLAFDFAVAHADAINVWLEESLRAGFIVGLAGGATDLAVAERVKSYAERTMPASSRLPAETVIAGIKISARLRAELMPAFSAWSRK